MGAKIVKRQGRKLTIEVDMELDGDLLTQEEAIQLALNEAGKLATREAMESFDKESAWTYALPAGLEMDQVRCVSVSRDGTTIHIRGQGWRETMSGTISLYGAKKKLLHTIHLGTAPEHGKAAFNEVLSREIELLKKQFKRNNCDPVWIGIADGAKDNWPFLECRTSCQVTDFYHVIERVGQFAALAMSSTKERKSWVDEISLPPILNQCSRIFS